MKKFWWPVIIVIFSSIDVFAQSVSFADALANADTPDGMSVGRTIDWMIRSFVFLVSFILAISMAWKFKEGDYESAFIKIVGFIIVTLSYSVAKMMAI